MTDQSTPHNPETSNDRAFKTGWKNPPSVRDLRSELQAANQDKMAQVAKIDKWLDNLNVGKLPKKKGQEGSANSRVQPRLIRKQAEWRYSALSEPFLSTPDLFNVSPVTYEDRSGAQQNQLVLNHQFNTRLNKTKFIDEYVRTAVDEGTVILRTGWAFEEETWNEEQPVFEYQPSQDAQTLQILQQIHQLVQENPEQAQQLPPEHLRAYELSTERGQPYRAVPVGTETVEMSRTLKNHPTVEICDYRNVTIDPTCGGDIEKAAFVVYSFESSLAQLEKDGKYQNLDNIVFTGDSPLNDPDHHGPDNQTFAFKDNSRKKLVVFEYWGYWDVTGNGSLVPIVAAWVGNTLIRLEENPFPDQKPPFVTVQYLPVRRSIYGEPDGALLEDNQQIAGAVTRGMIDLLAKSANSQTGVRKDMLDATNRRKFLAGLDYEFNSGVDPRQGVHMHTFPEIPASAQYMLQLQNIEAESMTGAKAFSNTGITGNALGDTTGNGRSALDAASKRELGILRRLADGIVQVGRKFIAMNAEFLSEEEVVRVTNEEFVPVRRDDLAGNYDLSLSISTAEEDNQKAQELAFMLQTLGPNEDPELRKMILSDICRLRKMPDLAKKLEAYQPQPDPLQQQKTQLELQLLQAQIAKTQAEAVENQAEAVLDQAKARNLDSDTDLKNLDFVEQESGTKQARDLEKQGAQAEAQARTKMLEHMLKQ